MHDKMKKLYREKKEWNENQAKVKALPKEYQVVYKEIENYLFYFWDVESKDMNSFYELIAFFEEGASHQIPIQKLVGDDVGKFAEEFRQRYKDPNK